MGVVPTIYVFEQNKKKYQNFSSENLHFYGQLFLCILHGRVLFVVVGDPEAEEILSNIVDYVTRDDNPNDEEQVRQILGKQQFPSIVQITLSF